MKKCTQLLDALPHGLRVAADRVRSVGLVQSSSTSVMLSLAASFCSRFIEISTTEPHVVVLSADFRLLISAHHIHISYPAESADFTHVACLPRNFNLLPILLQICNLSDHNLSDLQSMLKYLADLFL